MGEVYFVVMCLFCLRLYRCDLERYYFELFDFGFGMGVVWCCVFGVCLASSFGFGFLLG